MVSVERRPLRTSRIFRWEPRCSRWLRARRRHQQRRQLLGEAAGGQDLRLAQLPIGEDEGSSTDCKTMQGIAGCRVYRGWLAF